MLTLKSNTMKITLSTASAVLRPVAEPSAELTVTITLSTASAVLRLLPAPQSLRFSQITLSTASAVLRHFSDGVSVI